MENSWLFAMIMTLLFFLGYAYNLVLAWMERKGYENGITAFLLIGGLAIAFFGMIPLIGIKNSLIALAVYLASSFWMVVGSWLRHRESERHDQNDALALAQEALGDEENSWWVHLATRDN